MGKMSRDKGRRGEVEVRDILKKAFYPNDEGKVSRTPMSGAWGITKILTGDLVCVRNEEIDLDIPFFFSVKLLAKKNLPSPFSILAGKPGILAKWLKEAENVLKGQMISGGQWKNHELIPLVMWRPDFSEWMVYMSRAGFEHFLTMFKQFDDPGVILYGNDWVNLPLSKFISVYLQPKVEVPAPLGHNSGERGM
jgi:hypothetical protein